MSNQETALVNGNQIRPFRDEEVADELAKLLQLPSFQAFLRLFPKEITSFFYSQLTEIRSIRAFKQVLMAPLFQSLLKLTTFSYDLSGKSNLKGFSGVTFLSNHRDIILDSAILNVLLFEAGLEMTRIAIGDNLFVKPFIEPLVKLADSIVVRRSLPPRAFIESSKSFSQIVDETIQKEHKYLWIAQREGRSKDSNDLTQPALLKMLALSGGGTPLENLMRKQIVPTSFSYEYDPCDYLKAKELLLRLAGNRYVKVRGEDLLSMKQGLQGYKGRVHIDIGTPLSSLIEQYEQEGSIPRLCSLEKNKLFEVVAHIIDREIHRRYRLYPSNFIAYDLLEKREKGLETGHYSPSDKEQFVAYLNEQVARTFPTSEEENRQIEHLILIQYANPLRNYLRATTTPLCSYTEKED